MAIATDPLVALRTYIESVAQDSATSANDRAKRLQRVRDDLEVTLGAVDDYLGRALKHEQAEAIVTAANTQRLRENADVRDELLRTGAATATELDEAGFLSREEIAHLEEEGLLEATAADVARHWNSRLHPRGRAGRFVPTPGLDQPGRSDPGVGGHVGGHVRKAVYGGQYVAEGPDGEIVYRPTKREAEHVARGEQPGADIRDFPTEPFAREPQLVRQARSMILSGRATTRDRFAHVDGDGRLVYSPERKALHDKIIANLIGDVTPPKGRKPRVFYTGGAYASGKGGVVDGHPPHRWKPTENVVDMDPDKIKAGIPEFAELQQAGDPEANLRTYEEAWDVAQGALEEVRKRGLDVIVDGVGNTTLREVQERVNAFTHSGYDKPRAVYVETPTATAIHNARMRMEGAIAKGKLESARYIPDDLMADQHAKVSAVFPQILAWWPGELELYNTDTWNTSKKAFDPPTLILSKDASGIVKVVDPGHYERFLAKAHDRVSADDVERAAATVGPTPEQTEGHF